MARDRSSPIRRPLMMAYTVVFIIFSIALVGPLIVIGNVIHSLADALFPGLVFGGTALVIWSISWRSAIWLTGEAIVVRNMFFVHEIPWVKVRDILLDEGLKIRLYDNQVIGSIQFGSSLLGAIAGYPTYRRPAERLNQALVEYREKKASIDIEQRDYFSFPWKAAICWYLFFTLPALARLYFLGRH